MDHWSTDVIATLKRLASEIPAPDLSILADYIGEQTTIEMNGNWTYWGSQGPCPVEPGTMVDVCLLNGYVYLAQEANGHSHASAKAWTARSGTGIKAYRLSKGTAQ